MFQELTSILLVFASAIATLGFLLFGYDQGVMSGIITGEHAPSSEIGLHDAASGTSKLVHPHTDLETLHFQASNLLKRSRPAIPRCKVKVGLLCFKRLTPPSTNSDAWLERSLLSSSVTSSVVAV